MPNIISDNILLWFILLIFAQRVYLLNQTLLLIKLSPTYFSRRKDDYKMGRIHDKFCFETPERIYYLFILLRSNSFNCDLYPFLYIVNVFKYSISVLINVLIYYKLVCKHCFLFANWKTFILLLLSCCWYGLSDYFII